MFYFKDLNFISTSAMTGVKNMEYDEYLLNKYISQNISPVLRFYRWKPVTLSIGRNQNINEIDLEECKKNNIDVVKRPTGGKAVLHQGEITYSFIGGKKHGLPDNIFDSYIEISKAIIKGLELLDNSENKFSIGNNPVNEYTNNSFCFATSIVTDINYQGKKLVGSAQLRRGDNFLQHGSILIEQDFKLLEKLFIDKIDTTNLLNLSEIIKEIDYKKIKENILKGFKNHFNIDTINLL
ncbi:MAG: lipoate--protein ligase family protein [Candidatus Sericytochromatia bacterium]